MVKRSLCLRSFGWIALLVLVACSGATNAPTNNPPPPATPPPAGGPDTTPPTAPAGLHGVPVSSAAIALSWNAAQDDVGVAGYRVYRNDALVATIDATSYQDNGLDAATTYDYSVQAFDVAGNSSADSNSVAVQTMASGALVTLGQLAASLPPGTWAELPTNNLLPTISEPPGVCCATGSIFPYSEDAVWDPAGKRLFFIGSDHIYTAGSYRGQRFIALSEATSTWSRMPDPPWFSNGVFHGYDHSAIDVANGILYHYPYGDSDRKVHRYDIAADQWLADTPNVPFRTCCVGVEYFPELGGLVVAGGGEAHVYRPGNNAWTQLNTTTLTMGDYHNFAEYNPVHRVVIFGGGNDSTDVYKLDASGTITKVADAPFQLRVLESIVTVDPVSGDFLVFGSDSTFWVYDVVANEWRQQTGTVPPLFSPSTGIGGDSPVALVIAAPISSYGVTVFVKHRPTDYAKVHVYKHRQ